MTRFLVPMFIVLGVVLLISAPAAAQAPDPFQSVVPKRAPVAPRPPRPTVSAGGYPAPVGGTFRDCADCPEMVVIPAGRFTMGSPDSEPGHLADEQQHQVAVRAPFAVGKYAVTFAEWDACAAAGGCSERPSDQGWGRDRHPAINVSWNDAQQYAQWLSTKTRHTYRLLTEAEWEYAARAGTVTAYSFGATISPSQANYGGEIGRTQPVGSYPPNPWGLYEMHGNVYQWVQDCYVSNNTATTDAGTAVEQAGCSARVVRGGSWADDPDFLRSATRHYYTPGIRYGHVGFRLSRTPGG
jgi:formylglycine-generating enzyme required for sulfatase activity